MTENFISVSMTLCLLSQLKEQLMLLEAQLEKQLEEATFSQSCSEELAQVRHHIYHTQHTNNHKCND